jgi:aryl-alcohol dehydrogenase-like predicted oxidoreductase
MSALLNDDRDRLVLGTAGLAGLWGKVDEDESVKTILYALEQGITHFDAAPAYADAERILAKALREWKGAQPFVSTKAGKLKADDPDSISYDFSPAGIFKSAQESLQLFGRDQLDLLFLHDPPGMNAAEIPYAVEAMQILQRDGLVKSIGIGGNYGASFAPFVANNGFTHFMGFNRYNIVNQTARDAEFIQLHNAGIQVWQASPLYMGLLGNKLDHYASTKPEWIPATDLQYALALKKHCDASGLSYTGLALQYVFNSSCINKLVLGASKLSELKDSIRFLESPLLRDEAMARLSESSGMTRKNRIDKKIQ